MPRKTSIFQKMLDRADLGEESLPLQPVVELLGDGRVLVENHKGVIEYSAEKIQARVSFGAVSVVGCNLRLRLMTGQKLVIVGRIDGVQVLRGRVK